MASGTMKTTYWLVTTAAVAAAGVVVYTRLSAGDPPLPQVPQVADAWRADVPQLALPPVVLPPDEPLAMPAVPVTPAVPPPLPVAPPVTLASGTEPFVPPVPVPAMPAAPAVPMYPAPVTSEPPFEPLVQPAPKPLLPPAPVTPEVPVKPALPSAAPLPPAPPLPAPSPVLQPPVPAKPDPLPPAAGVAPPRVPPEPLAVGGKYVVLKDDKLIEGGVSVSGDTVLVRQGALDRPFPKSQVQFVAASRDEVYRFMLAKVSADDAAARLKVARWCMFSGLREQALAEAREVQKLQPNGPAAADLIRSLELSLQQFPPDGAAKMSAPAVPTFPAELRPAPLPVPPAAPVTPVEPEPDVSPEAALVFGARVQPFLANQCVECHAKPDAGKFKLVRVNPADAGPQATRANLRAVAGQLRKDDPAASPLLMKSLAAHGGMKLPAVVNRQAAVYQSLEAWTALAVGTPLSVPPAPAPAPPVPLMPPVADPVPPVPFPLPPVTPAPLPLPLPVPPPVADPLLPPAVPFVPAPAPLPKPIVPAIPPADPFEPILPPAPPPKPVPAAPPFIPPATAGLKPPSPVVPVGGTQFGAAVPPKPPVTGPTGGDEFDPAGFNKPK